ncbi:hypothetical protein GQ457_10G011560 [Hibiscus cannabinus]
MSYGFEGYENVKGEPDENVTKMFDRFSVTVNGLKGLGEVIPEEKLRTGIIEAKDLKTLNLDALMGSLLTDEIMKQGREEKKREEKKLEKNDVEKKKIRLALKATQEEKEEDSKGKEISRTRARRKKKINSFAMKVANLCLMALEEDSKVASNYSKCDLTYDELLEEYEELQEVYDKLYEKYKESI